MANLEYCIIHHPVKDINKDPSLLQEAYEVSYDELVSTAYLETDSVMSGCNNFITIYSYPTWFKKFGKN